MFCFFAPLFSTCLYSSPYQAGIHTIPLLSTTSKGRLEWMDRAQECADQRENKGGFQTEGHDFVLVRWEPKDRRGKFEKLDERRHEMHSFTLTLSHSVSFIFFLPLSLSLRDWGFPVTWALGSPLLILSLVLRHISFSSSMKISISFPCLFAHDQAWGITDDIRQDYIIRIQKGNCNPWQLPKKKIRLQIYV